MPRPPPGGAGWPASRPATIADCKLQIADLIRPNLQSAIYNLQLGKEHTVSHYTLDELIARWKKGTVTVEQVIGQLLQLLRVHDERLRELERARREGTAPPSRGS
jgi:hypothetical protein